MQSSQSQKPYNVRVTHEHVVFVRRRVRQRLRGVLLLVVVVVVDLVPGDRSLEIFAERGLNPSAVSINGGRVVDPIGDGVARDALVELGVARVSLYIL